MEDDIDTLLGLTRAAARAGGNFSEDSGGDARFLDFDFRPDLNVSAGLFERRSNDHNLILRIVCLLERREDEWQDLGVQVLKASGDEVPPSRAPRMKFEGTTASKLRSGRFSRPQWVSFSVLEMPKDTASISAGPRAKDVQARSLVVSVWRSKSASTGKDQPILSGFDSHGQRIF